MRNTEGCKLLGDWRRNHIQAISPERQRNKNTKRLEDRVSVLEFTEVFANTEKYMAIRANRTISVKD